MDREPAPLTANLKDGPADMILNSLDSFYTQLVDGRSAGALPPRDPNDDDEDEDEEDEEDEEPPVVREPDEE